MSKQYKAIQYLTLLIVIIAVLIQSVYIVSASESLQTDAIVEITPGDLELVSVPSISGNIVLDRKTRYKHYGSLEGSGSFVIEDARTTKAGWKLSVTLSPFVSKFGKNNTLSRATLYIEPPVLKSYDNQDISGFVGTEIELVPGDKTYHTYLSAPTGTPDGVWEGTVPGGSIVIPKTPNSRSGTFHATMDWLLEDTP